MKVENKELFPLKNGCLFVILTVVGKRGERLSLAKQGISRKLVFFHEAPKTNIQCSYFPEQNELELASTAKKKAKSCPSKLNCSC